MKARYYGDFVKEWRAYIKVRVCREICQSQGRIAEARPIKRKPISAARTDGAPIAEHRRGRPRCGRRLSTRAGRSAAGQYRSLHRAAEPELHECAGGFADVTGPDRESARNTQRRCRRADVVKRPTGDREHAPDGANLPHRSGRPHRSQCAKASGRPHYLCAGSAAHAGAGRVERQRPRPLRSDAAGARQVPIQSYFHRASHLARIDLLIPAKDRAAVAIRGCQFTEGTHEARDRNMSRTPPRESRSIRHSSAS